MNKNVLIVLAGGLVIAILVAVMVQAGLSDKKEASAPQVKTEILVAARPLKIGTEIGEADVKWQEWPAEMMFDGAIQRAEDTPAHKALEGRLKERVASGQPMHKDMMVDAEKGNMLAAALRPGYRAVGVRVPTQTIAGGLIGPGDYVDVILTYTLKRTGNSTIARKFGTETILENVRVLGIDSKSIAQDLKTEDKKRKSSSRLTVTLEVDVTGAEKISLAEEMGEIKLSLRSLGDSGPVDGDKATTDVGLSKVLEQMVGGRGGGVRVYNGTETHYLVSGGQNDQIGRDPNEDNLDLEGGSGSDGDMLPPESMMDAVREGIADGLSRRMSGDEE